MYVIGRTMVHWSGQIIKHGNRSKPAKPLNRPNHEAYAMAEQLTIEFPPGTSNRPSNKA